MYRKIYLQIGWSHVLFGASCDGWP